MIDPSLIQLSKTLYNERLQEAAEYRLGRLTRVAAPSPIERLWQAIGTRFISLFQRPQAPVVWANVQRIDQKVDCRKVRSVAK